MFSVLSTQPHRNEKISNKLTIKNFEFYQSQGEVFWDGISQLIKLFHLMFTCKLVNI